MFDSGTVCCELGWYCFPHTLHTQVRTCQRSRGLRAMEGPSHTRFASHGAPDSPPCCTKPGCTQPATKLCPRCKAHLACSRAHSKLVQKAHKKACAATVWEWVCGRELAVILSHAVFRSAG